MSSNLANLNGGSRWQYLKALFLGGLLFCWGVIFVQPVLAFTARVDVKPICDQNCQIIDVSLYGVKPNQSADSSVPLSNLLKRFKRNVIFYFPSGTYRFAQSVREDGLDNVRFEGAAGTVWQKANPFRGEYLFMTRLSNGVAFNNLVFKGNTTNRHAYRWGESGIYLGSSNGIVIERNRFYDFGDAAIRVTSSNKMARGVSSSNSVVKDNYFENVTQITTTSNQNGYGGSIGYLLENNEFRNLKGSVKFATRMPGAAQIIVLNNRISGVPALSTSVGIEVVGYSNVFIEDNEISDCGGFAMNIYSNPGRNIRGFDWGNYLIRGNRVESCAKGIRVSVQPFADGYRPRVKDIRIVENSLHIKTGKPIQVVNGQAELVTVQRNRMMTY
jgi:hypothetical protein